MHLLIPYDITDDKRRRKVDKLLSSYGKSVNYSVFEVEISKTKFKVLIQALKAITDKKYDHVRVYVLNKEALKNSFVLHKNSKVFKDDPLYI